MSINETIRKLAREEIINENASEDVKREVEKMLKYFNDRKHSIGNDGGEKTRKMIETELEALMVQLQAFEAAIHQHISAGARKEIMDEDDLPFLARDVARADKREKKRQRKEKGRERKEKLKMTHAELKEFLGIGKKEISPRDKIKKMFKLAQKLMNRSSKRLDNGRKEAAIEDREMARKIIDQIQKLKAQHNIGSLREDS